MLTINPVNLNATFNKKYISFGETNNVNRNNTKTGVMSIDKNNNTRVHFEKDMFESKKADVVQSNPIKAIGYNFVKAYNILCTPKRRATQTESTYIHIPYMA